MQYIPLHNHTEHSTLDGLNRTKDLVKVAKKLNAPMIGITDHGVCSGVVEFYQDCKAEGIEPVLGMEAYFVPDRTLRGSEHSKSNHLCVYAKNSEGYKNLLRLSSEAYQSGFYYKPRTDWELLDTYKDGLLVTSACLASIVSRNVLNDNYDEAKKTVLKFKELFGEDFYLELMLHPNSPGYESDLEEKQLKVNKGVIKLINETGTKAIITNDAHYTTREDFMAHEVLLCIQTKDFIDNSKRMSYDIPEFYIKPYDEVANLYVDAGFDRKLVEECLQNTWEVAEKCKGVEIDMSPRYPKYKCPDEFEDNVSYMKHLVGKGWKRKLAGKDIDALVYKDRVGYEFGVVTKLGWTDYMLIVQDYIRFAKGQDIPVGPGRGSSAGSLLAYLLDITEVDPIKYNLKFERFLNPHRVSPPDIDTDFAAQRRSEVQGYIESKYPAANIGTSGTLSARAVIRDICRVYRIDNTTMQEMLDAIPEERDEQEARKAMTLEEAYKRKVHPPFNTIVDKMKDVYKIIFRIEGLKRHDSTHAAGIVIADHDLEGMVPLRTSKGIPVSQFNDKTCEKIGLLKIDVLGLKMLDTIEGVVREIKERDEINFQVAEIPTDDKKAWDLIKSTKTIGIFQLESDAMRDLLGKLHPDNIRDLAAVMALFRPGPYRSGVTDEYVRRKTAKRHQQLVEVKTQYTSGVNGNGSQSYANEEMERILGPTHGCLVFQEQVMELAERLANYHPAEADELRRAIGKQLTEEMRQHREKFVAGCSENKIAEDKANKLFNQFEQHAIYSFNASHAVSYALLGYRAAYMKAHYPLYFAKAFLNTEGSEDNMGSFLNEVKGVFGISFGRPDINSSGLEFEIAEGNKIVAGIAQIKGIGEKTAELILKEREKNGTFKSYMEFCLRNNLSKVNKKVLIGLAKSGAFNNLGYDKEQLANTIPGIHDDVRKAVKKAQKKKEEVPEDFVNEMENIIKRGRATPAFKGTPQEYIGKLFKATPLDQIEIGLTEGPVSLIGYVCGGGKEFAAGMNLIYLKPKEGLREGLSLINGVWDKEKEVFKVDSAMHITSSLANSGVASKVLETMKKECLDCNDCDFRKGATQVVFGEGKIGKIMFVGEAPGANEDSTGRPFVGEAGQTLRDVIEEVGDPNVSYFITNVVKCRPPGNKTPSPKDCKECLKWLERQIWTIQPKIIVGLGNVPLKALTGKRTIGITKNRGKLQKIKVGEIEIPFMPTYHPQYLNYNRDKPHFREEFSNDIREAFYYVLGKNKAG